jgi:hypothetical protein
MRHAGVWPGVDNGSTPSLLLPVQTRCRLGIDHAYCVGKNRSADRALLVRRPTKMKT